MQCPECGNDIRIKKRLGPGKSNGPDSCPDCGADLDEKSNSPHKLSK